jgi:hypothetical protein
MAITHSFLAGTAINYRQSLFFELMESGDVYMGFARSNPVWGFASLLKIQHSRTWSTSVMAQAGGGTSQAQKFYDSNKMNDLPSADVTVGDDRVYISYILKTSDASIPGNHNVLATVDIGTLTLDYMNEEWAQIQGMNTDFLEDTITQFPVDTYDYYLFNHEIGTDTASRTFIETVSKITLPRINQPVRLMYSTALSPVGPTTSFGNNLIGDLVEEINIFGERKITGLNNTFVTDGSGYIPGNSLTTATFYLTTADGIVTQGDMKYVEQIKDGNEISLIFSYPLVAEAVQNSGRLRITTTADTDKLAIFNERFSDGVFVSDNVPPPLFLNYLKIPMFHTSIFDVKGLVRIDATDVDFARRVDNEDTYNLLFGSATDPVTFPGVPELTLTPGTPAPSALITITIEDDPSTSVDYAVTNDISVARRFGFDLARVQKTLDSTTPTDSVYRQLFLCYRPKDKDGDDLSVSQTEFVHADIFQDTDVDSDGAAEWGYELGTILFLVNKKPVFRRHLAQNEQFTLLV